MDGRTIDRRPAAAAGPGPTPELLPTDDSVAIITRTKDRPILLRRAMLDVLRQRHRNWVHVIVNDGGEPGPVDGLARALEPDYAGRLTVVHNPTSVGMEAASNIGLRRSQSRYVVIHDDDDSWDPDFLSATIDALQQTKVPNARGIVVHCLRVRERIDGDTVTELGRDPFNTWMESISIVRLAHSNTFPPIAFLFERSTLDEIGYFDEELPVLGDWDFHLRFAVRWEIAVLGKVLAFYHHRVSSDDGIYGNTVTAFEDKHRLFRTLLMNRILRRDIAAGRLGVADLINIAELRESVLWQGGAWERFERTWQPRSSFAGRLLRSLRRLLGGGR